MKTDSRTTLPLFRREGIIFRWPRCSSLLVCGIAGAHVAIWLLMPGWKKYSGGSMKFNTALSLLGAAVALFLLDRAESLDIAEHRNSRTFRLAGRTAAFLPSLLGALTLLEYLFEVRLGIDEWAVLDFPSQESLLYLGRMSPLAAFCLTFLGLGLLAMASPARKKDFNPSVLLVFPVLMPSLFAALGYLYDVPAFYQIGSTIRISWQTTACLFILATGVLFSRPREGFISLFITPGPGGITARRLLPLTFLIPIVLGWLRIQGEKHGWYGMEFGTALRSAVSILLYSGLVWFNAKQLDRIDSARLKTEERLRASEKKFSLIYERAPFGIALVKSAGFQIADVNPALEKLVGYSRKEMVGRTGLELRLMEDLNASARIREELACRGFLENQELTISSKAGKEVTLAAQINPIELEDEGLLLVTLQDITELKKAEMRLRENEELFRTMANSIPQLAWMADPTGHIFWYNQRWYDYTGSTVEEMRGWGWEKVQNPEMLQKVLSKWRHALEVGEPWDDTFQLKGRDGQYRWFLSRAEPVKDGSGTIVRWFGSNTDITEHRKNILDLQETKAELLEAIRSRDDFLSIASHELKTPLTSLRLQSNAVSRSILRGDVQAFAPERIRRLVELTERQVTRLVRLVDDMLDISRIRSGRLSMEFEEFDLRELVQEVIERMLPQLIEAGNKEPDFTCSEPIRGNWDRSRIEQVVINLLTNGMRYGKGRPLEIRMAWEGGLATIRVRDHGIGIALENQARIFDRFERAVSPNEVSGMGLGLYISRQIVEAHGGSIRVESTLGEGATFIVALPPNPPPALVLNGAPV